MKFNTTLKVIFHNIKHMEKHWIASEKVQQKFEEYFTTEPNRNRFKGSPYLELLFDAFR